MFWLMSCELHRQAMLYNEVKGKSGKLFWPYFLYQDMNYPDEAGFPFGEGSSPTYFMMEVHYDNPQLLQGRKDSSGIWKSRVYS